MGILGMNLYSHRMLGNIKWDYFQARDAELQWDKHKSKFFPGKISLNMDVWEPSPNIAFGNCLFMVFFLILGGKKKNQTWSHFVLKWVFLYKAGILFH